MKKINTIKKTIKMKLSKNLSKITSASLGAFSMVMFVSQNVLASDTSAVTGPLDNLKALLFAAIGVIGVIVAGKNIAETAQAFQQADSASMNSGIKGIVAGVIMAGIGGVVTFLGL